MPKLMIADSYVDIDTIASISSAKANKSGGMFEFRAGTEVCLKDGRVLMEQRTVEELVKELQAVQQIPQVSPAGQDDLLLLMEDLLKTMKSATEHLHTISECLIKQTMRPQ